MIIKNLLKDSVALMKRHNKFDDAEWAVVQFKFGTEFIGESDLEDYLEFGEVEESLDNKYSYKETVYEYFEEDAVLVMTHIFE